MTSVDFVQSTGKFIEDSPAFDYLLRLLLATAKYHHLMRADVHNLAAASANTSQAISAQTAFRSNLSQFSTTIRSDYNTRQVWAGVENAGRRARDLSVAHFAQEVGENISDHLAKFSDAFEQFLKTYSVEETFTLIETGNDLYLVIDSLRMTAMLTQKALVQAAELEDGEAEIQLSFSSSPTLEELAAKLTALSVVYAKLCELLTISTATNPLRIVKVETGTWVAKLVGALPIVGMISRLLESSVRYCYRNYTTEGKLSTLPRKAEAAEAILNLRRELDAAGIGSSQIDANIQSAVVALAQDLNTLVGGELRIAINSTELVASEDWATLQLDRPNRMIEDAEHQRPEPPGPQ